MKTFNINKVWLLVVFVAFYFNSIAQDWNVPANESAKVYSKAFTKTTARDGKDLFNANCKSCHGGVGENASLPLNPEPGDPAADKFAKQTDGDLFYKLTVGQGGMPGFASQMSDDERWSIISYIRTFHKDYVPTGNNINVAVETEDSFTGSDIKIFVNLDIISLEVIANITGKEANKTVPANGVRVGFYVKRNFGMLQIGDIVTSDADGVVKMNFPSDLPGDSLGNIKMLIKLIDEDVYGKVEFTQTLDWGEEFIYENPLDHRAMWGNRANAPLWLLFSYFGIVISVWLTIAWVVFQLVKLKDAK